MTFINMPLSEAKPPEPVPEGLYNLLIEAVDKIEEPDGKIYLQIRHSVIGEPEAGAVFHRLGITLADDPNKAKWAMLFIKAYLKVFDFPYSGNGWDDEEVIPGAQAECFLERTEWQGVVSNRIKLDPNKV